MKNLTLVIPAKNEEYSLPKVLEEIKNINCKKFIILGNTDVKTIRSIKNYNCKIIKQKKNGCIALNCPHGFGHFFRLL